MTDNLNGQSDLKKTSRRSPVTISSFSLLQIGAEYVATFLTPPCMTLIFPSCCIRPNAINGAAKSEGAAGCVSRATRWITAAAAAAGTASTCTTTLVPGDTAHGSKLAVARSTAALARL